MRLQPLIHLSKVNQITIKGRIITVSGGGGNALINAVMVVMVYLMRLRLPESAAFAHNLMFMNVAVCANSKSGWGGHIAQ